MRLGGHAARRLAGILVLAAATIGSAPPLHAQNLTQDEALALAFPGATVERQTAYLDDAQLARARALAGDDVEIESGIVSYYVAGTEGVAYFDAHRVRTLPEVLMIIVGPDARVRRIETVRFREPPEYEAPEGWMQQFDGRALDDRLSVRRDIANITGATLTSRAVTAAVRRTLALHAVIHPFGEPDGAPSGHASGDPSR